MMKADGGRDGGRRTADGGGGWQLAVGSWQLAVGSWRLADGVERTAYSLQLPFFTVSAAAPILVRLPPGRATRRAASDRRVPARHRASRPRAYRRPPRV